MAMTYKVLGQAQATTTQSVAYTVPSAKSAVISTISLANTSNADALASLYVYNPAAVRALSWTTRTSTFGSSNINALTYGNGLYVAAGDGGALRTSTDAITWTTQTISLTNPLQSLTFGNSLYVVGDFYGGIATSTNGVTWTTRTSGINALYALTYGNGLYIGGGGTGITTSTDGTTWTTRTSGLTNTQDLTFGNGLYVAGSVSDQLATSTNGITWTFRTSNFGGSTVRSLTYGNGLFVAGGSNGQINTSTDGITWTTRVTGFGGGAVITSLGYGNGTFIAGSFDFGYMVTSSDGITWTSVTSTISGTIQAITYGNGTFVASGNSGQLRTSVEPSNGIFPLLFEANMPANSTTNLTFGLVMQELAAVQTSANTNNAVTVHLFGSEIS